MFSKRLSDKEKCLPSPVSLWLTFCLCKWVLHIPSFILIVQMGLCKHHLRLMFRFPSLWVCFCQTFGVFWTSRVRVKQVSLSLFEMLSQTETALFWEGFVNPVIDGWKLIFHFKFRATSRGMGQGPQ